MEMFIWYPSGHTFCPTCAPRAREAGAELIAFDDDDPTCSLCSEPFDDAGDGYGDLCPTCADAHEDAFERGLALAHDGISGEVLA